MFARVSQSLVKRCARPSTFMMRQPLMVAFPQRMYLKNLGLDSESLAVVNQDEAASDNLELWREQVQETEKGLVLRSDDEIERYVLSIVRDYFRTTKKGSLTLDSTFADHGLDSLDAIELIIKVEDELGYMIDAENLELFRKPRHFVNFIKQMEAYKEEFNQLPIDGTQADISLRAAFPGIPGLTEKSEASEHH